MIKNFLNALALVFVFEGIYPFISPEKFRRTLERALKLDDKTLRIMSLISMLLGLVLLYFVHQYVD